MTPTPPVDATAPCRCGHGRDLHEHDRPGSDCGIGGPAHCASFRNATPRLRRLAARIVRPSLVDDGTPLAPVHALTGARSLRTARARVVAASQPFTGTADLPRVAP